MTRKSLSLSIILMLCILSPFAGKSQAVLYNQNFEDTASLFQDYLLSNFDNGIPAGSGWSSLKDSAWVVRSISGFNTHAAVGTSAYDPTKPADDWFITPGIRLGKASKLSFKSLSLTAGTTDTYEVYISNTDQTVNGCQFNFPLSEYTSSQSAGFESHLLDLSAAGYSDQTVYLGFRLTTSSGGDKIAIDDIRVADDSLQSLASLTFVVDMSKYIDSGSFHPYTDTVDVAGNFNGWDGTLSIMSRVAGPDSSVYAITIPGFHDGDHLEFKFRINSSWSDTSLEFPYGAPNRVWDVLHDRYTYTAFYNEQGTVSAIPDLKDALSGVKVYPNPVMDELKIAVPRGIETIRIFSINGKKVNEWRCPGDSVLIVDTSSLPSGVYLLLFYDKSSVAGSRKLIRR